MYTVDVKLQNCSFFLIGPQIEMLPVTENFSILLCINITKTIADNFVVEGLTQSLLGWPAMKSLSMLLTIQNLSENRFIQK